MPQKRGKKSQTLISIVFYPLAPQFPCCVCVYVQATGLGEATALHVGGQSETDGWGDDPPPPPPPPPPLAGQNSGSSATQNPSMWTLCEWRFVCQGDERGLCYGSEDATATGSPQRERLILCQHLFRGKFSPLPSVSSPHTQKS